MFCSIHHALWHTLTCVHVIYDRSPLNTIYAAALYKPFALFRVNNQHLIKQLINGINTNTDKTLI